MSVQSKKKIIKILKMNRPVTIINSHKGAINLGRNITKEKHTFYLSKFTTTNTLKFDD